MNETAAFILGNFKTGDSIEIIGSVINETWEKDGVKQYRNRIQIKEVNFAPRQNEINANIIIE